MVEIDATNKIYQSDLSSSVWSFRGTYILTITYSAYVVPTSAAKTATKILKMIIKTCDDDNINNYFTYGEL